MDVDVQVSRPPGVAAVTVATSLTAHVLALAVPLALLQTYDRILPNQAYGTTFVLAVGVSAAILLEAVLRYGRAVLFAHVGALYERRMTVALLDQVMRAEGRAVHQLGAPALSDALRAVGQVRDFWSGSAGAALHEAPFAVIYVALIAYVGGLLAAIPLVLTLLALVAAVAVVRATSRAVHDLDAAESARRDLVWGIFAGIVHARSMAAETALTRRFRDTLVRSAAAGERVEIMTGLIRENGAMLAQISTIAIATFGAFMVVDGRLTTGGLAACTMLAGRSIGPTMTAFAYLARRRHRAEAESKIAGVLALPKAPVFAAEGGRDFNGGAVSLEGDLIQGGRASIPQGAIVRIVAADAQAASAVLGAIARLAEVPGLTVAYDGRPGAEYNAKSLNRHTMTVVARPLLIRGTILENLTLFAPQYDAEAIVLSERLGLREFVDGLRQGFMTQVGAVGAHIISSGLAARIGLVRALVRQPLLLCLDEVDATLDLDGVKRLAAILQELKGRTTVLIISDNPVLLKLTDQTIVLAQRSAP